MTDYTALRGWSDHDARPALAAFQQSCARILSLADEAPVARTSAFAGQAQDWRPACAAAALIHAQASAAAEARGFFETWFTPARLGGQGRLTGYYEPFVEVRDAPDAEFSMAIRAAPTLQPQAETSGGLTALIGSIEHPQPRWTPGRERAPTRAEIERYGIGAPLAWGRPIDVFFLQIQGSGRLHYPDGREARAAFAAHNGHGYVSIGRILLDRGELRPGQASKQDIQAWLRARGPQAWTELFNENPRYVFFRLAPVTDPHLGPLGAEGVPLTPMGSMAVDPQHQAWGAPIFVEANLPGAPNWSGLVVAQDAGGAITGPVRGDLFYGWGPEAGDRAGRQNDPGARWTVLLPRSIAARLS
ncbi:MAG: MltA domain-containing protein [Pseudomonadota bacterium]